MTNRIDAKKVMLRHSEAKVEFFKKYLERYLRILYLAPPIAEINIFDAFCGTGIYENGKKGSPIVAFESIAQIRSEYEFTKPINLIVNDGRAEKIELVREHIDQRNQQFCTVSYHAQPSDEMFAEILRLQKTQSKNGRNLIFIDPYGYKEIKKETLQDLLSNQRTEIILFLPISQMQRFTPTAMASELKPYEPLKQFVDSFFPGDHSIKKETVSALKYIDFLKDALRFDAYYSTSYYIERDESSYYALFFVSPHVYGFEKILEVKWQLDDESGRGFRQPEWQTSLFDAQDKELQKIDNDERLEKILEHELKTPKTNQDLYGIVLKNEFLPRHAAEIFRAWQDKNPNFKVADVATKTPARKGAFYIDWKWCNPAKSLAPKAIFSLDR